MRKTWISVLVVLAMVVSACGLVGGDGEGGGDGQAAAGCEPGETDGDLSLYNWTEYIDPELVTQFEEEFGVTITEDFYPSNEELLARLQAGATDYDVIVPSDYMVDSMIELDLLMPLNKEALPNASNIADRFSDPPYDPGNEHSMPYQWGTTGIGINYDATGEDVEPSWALIFDPSVAGQYDGQISMLDDAREVMGAALKYLGYSLNTTDEAQLQEAGDLVEQAAASWVATFDSVSFPELLVSGETVMGHGWSGGFATAMFENPDMNLGYIIPQEGAVVWVDTMAIPNSAPHPCTAHTFIDFILDAENGAALTNWTYYASPNAAAEGQILEEILQDPTIYPPDDTMQNLEFIEDVGETTTIYEQEFTEAKS